MFRSISSSVAQVVTVIGAIPTLMRSVPNNGRNAAKEEGAKNGEKRRPGQTSGQNGTPDLKHSDKFAAI